ncbi:MAG: FkbM family methyltransferase [Chitinispirillales bacterium]|jgi:FkbM family methyltransferase|nr:FkbM family methyltransferase [Chitinispirillales bacterium]
MKTTYIWGAGYYGALTALDMEIKGEPIAGFIDSNKDLYGKKRLGYEVLSPEQVIDKNSRDSKIIIAILKSEEIAEKLIERNYICGIDFELSQRLWDKETKKKVDIFCKHFLKTKENGECYFEIAGAKLPDVRYSQEKMTGLFLLAPETFLFSYFMNDRYDKHLAEIFDIYISGGSYGYKDGNFDVSVKKGDIVIDAGAWIGDFSAYASTKGAISYAFEPTSSIYELLQKTAELNSNIYSLKQGLSNVSGEASLSIHNGWGVANSIVINRSDNAETISITTLDEFVKENNISKVDFIKADIEGAERDMLKGAAWVLKNYAPKLAICTYHLPDDPQVLESIILEANPDYKIVHLRDKLFAQVVKEEER